MKLFLKAACAAFVLCVLYSMIPFHAQCSDIQREVFRLHIIANSDSAQDQELKLRIRDRLLESTKQLFENAGSKQEAESLAAKHLSELARIAADEVRRSGYSYPVSAEITKMYFTTRHYEKYTLPSGMYDALRITIGEGRGHNWWCVMFPSLCIDTGGSGDRKTREALGEEEYKVISGEKREYKFFIVEMFEKTIQMFS